MSADVGVASRARGFRVDRRGIARLCATVLAAEGAGDRWLSVAVVDDPAIRDLNRRYHGQDRATDVLAFPLDGGPAGPPGLGEVVCSVETAAREARRRGLPLARELARYAVHGTLHLLGYDDHAPGARRRMRRRERVALRGYPPGRGRAR